LIEGGKRPHLFTLRLSVGWPSSKQQHEDFESISELVSSLTASNCSADNRWASSITSTTRLPRSSSSVERAAAAWGITAAMRNSGDPPSACTTWAYSPLTPIEGLAR
jgi:hypothetical protein